MGVSKRTRFEVLRRDNHTCRYCRATDQPLTIDHVTPVSLGGTDDPSNLVTACRDCNAGKSSSSPDAPLVADVGADAVRWANARREASSSFDQERKERSERVSSLLEVWSNWNKSLSFLPVDWEEKVNQWLDGGLTMGRVLDAYTIALGRPNVPAESVFSYMCGIARNWLAEIDKRTADLLANSSPDSAATICETCNLRAFSIQHYREADHGYRLLLNVVEGTCSDERDVHDRRMKAA